ncbi:MAG: radical SAM protein [Candidatus Thorarchaeota archaeon]|nr:radical SAM protein [Candidatus Thorarchaeota archaeon]
MRDPQGMWATADMLILIAGMIVPGKYIGGTPISVKEASQFFSDNRLLDIPKLLTGPWARFGCGLEGGELAVPPDILSPPFDFIVPGDPEVVLSEIAQIGWNPSDVDLSYSRQGPDEIRGFAVRGANVVVQHPGHAVGYAICEIETYRGCPRYISGGCSFCTEPFYGHPQQRDAVDIAAEVRALHEYGIQAFRIGNQADLFTYGSTEIGEDEFPRPSPEAVESLFAKIRRAAPDLTVLHIDNVNPGTIAIHPEESRAIAKIVMKYHTTGDVAALGVESLDPEVQRRNNLKADEDQVLDAIRLLNEVGGFRPPRELPHLLPGINLLYGLPGESKKTLEANYAFLKMLLAEGLLVRRINIRQVIGFPGTLANSKKKPKIKRNEFFRHKKIIRQEIDIEMLRNVAPLGTIIRHVFIDQDEVNYQLLRPLGSYPLLCYMPKGQDLTKKRDVFVVGHGPRSLTVLPFPLHPNMVSMAQWRAIRGFGAKRAARLRTAPPLHSYHDLEHILDVSFPDWLKQSLDFEQNSFNM